MHTAKPKTGILLSFICLFILGSMPIIANSRPMESSALEFAFFLSLWQLVFGLPLFVYELRSGSRGVFSAGAQRPKFKTLAICISTGAMFGLSTWFYVLSMEQAGAVNASIAIQSYPLFAVLTEMALLKKIKSAQENLVTLILVLTLYYLGTQGSWQIQGISLWFLLALTVPLLWSIAHVLIRQELLHSPVTPAQVTFLRVLISVVFLGIIFAFSDGNISRLFHPGLLPYSIVMGLFYYMELIAWFYAMRHIDVSLASTVTTPWPAVTMVLSLCFLGEYPKGYQVISFLIVAASIYALLVLAVRNR